MIEQNAFPSSQPEPQSLTNASEDRQTSPSGKRDETRNAVPCFTVTESIIFKPMTTPERKAGHLPPDVVRLVSAISLSATPLWHLSDCSDIVERGISCPVPIPPSPSTGIPVPSATRTLTITHKTKSGRHYIWNHSRGGWFESDDGLDPKQEARGVVEGQSGTGHGGSEGGY